MDQFPEIYIISLIRLFDLNNIFGIIGKTFYIKCTKFIATIKYIFEIIIIVICISNHHLWFQIDQPKNIILLIGDGMALSQISAARTVAGNQLNMLRCDYIGIQSTHAADKYVTDSGASATAMACGEKTNYYTIGVDTDGNPLTSIIELAEANGMSTGIMTTSTIVHATPAAFFAHQNDRSGHKYFRNILSETSFTIPAKPTTRSGSE